MASASTGTALLCVLPPLCFMGMQVSSLQTAYYRIYKEKSTGSLSSVPFLSMFVNGIVWTFYGILKGDMTVLVPNMTSVVVGSICLGTYNNYSTVGTPKLLYVLSSFILSVCFTLLLLQDSYHIGLIGVLMAITLMGSPLAALKTVLRDKSTEALPFNTSLATFCNALTWSLYGVIVSNDAMVYIPNILGLLLACLQLGLFCTFGIADSNNKYTTVPKSIPLVNTSNSNGYIKV